jgi:predicted RNA-binding Zn ribbon-like protein
VDPFEKPWHGLESERTPALALANTLDWRLREKPIELLKDYAELVRWARSVGALEPAEARALRAWGEEHPKAAARVLAEAVELREAVAAVAASLTKGRAPQAAPLARVEGACRAAHANRVLRPTSTGARWVWREAIDPQRPLWAAALDAEHLLTSDDAARVRQCGDAECGWFFLDTSRNRSRRWCSMEVCGNRNKARRFYKRAAKGRTAVPRGRETSGREK